MNTQPTIASKRRETRAHYDRYPFGFDQPEILAEKLEKRMMGEAIRKLRGGELVIDVGCGACRVAQLVKRTSGSRAVGIDLSMDSLREARRSAPGPLVQGDNLHLPLRAGCADLVISNGVIHHTPDAKASFLELARITRRGGTLIVSVYNRKSWYYYAYRWVGGLVRGLRPLIGDGGLKVTLFPVFHVATLALLSVVTRRLFPLPMEASWRLFHDQFTTPQCTFHTFAELAGWAGAVDMVCEEQRKEAANQLATLRFRRSDAS